MSNEQKLREALSELMSIVSIHQNATRNNFAWAEMDFAREALATTEPAVNQQLTTELDEREAFEREMMRRKSWTVYDFQPHPRRGEYPHPDYLTPHANTAWAGWQARAAMAKG